MNEPLMAAEERELLLGDLLGRWQLLHRQHVILMILLSNVGWVVSELITLVVVDPVSEEHLGNFLATHLAGVVEGVEAIFGLEIGVSSSVE